MDHVSSERRNAGGVITGRAFTGRTIRGNRVTVRKGDSTYRLYLRVLAKLMIALGAMGVVYVFVAALISGEDDENALDLMRVTISDIKLGTLRTLSWEGRPVLVYRRTPEQIASLSRVNVALRDERSIDSQQPSMANNTLRSNDEQWFIAIALGTDYGCPLELKGELIVDTCRGSRYDLAGRVYTGGYADRNLVVPRYTLNEDGSVLLGR